MATQRPFTIPSDIRWMNNIASMLFTVAVLATVVVTVRWFIHLPIFAVRVIHVNGDTEHNTPTTLRTHILHRLEGNVFTMDLAQAKRAFESAPWVRRAIVRREWPNQLTVTLEEHKAYAYWQQVDAQNSRDDQIVNTFGEIFVANSGDIEDEPLPILSGPDGTASIVMTMKGQLDPLFQKIAQPIAVLTLGSRGNWLVGLKNGALIQLGRGSDEEVLQRTQAFVDTVTRVTTAHQAPLAYADLRHRDGYAVRLRGVTTTADAASAPRAARPPHPSTTSISTH